MTLACGDLLDPAAVPTGRADLVIANLPYLTSDEVATGVGSLAWEPRRALDGGADGLDLVRRLDRRAARPTWPTGGVALLEIGRGQAAVVRAEIDATGVRAAVTTLSDLAGIERSSASRWSERACPRPMPDRLAPDDAGLARAASLLRDGQLVAFPTDTVYGIGCRIGRPRCAGPTLRRQAAAAGEGGPLARSPRSTRWRDSASAADERASRLAERFWPGALTLVVPAADGARRRRPSASPTTR